MKARLIRNEGTITLMLCSGTVILMNEDKVREFFCSYNDSSAYDMTRVIDTYVQNMIMCPGETLAYVNDENDLVIRNPQFFTGLFTIYSGDYITAQEYAERHGKTSAIIKRFCRDNRIPGAIKIGGRWCVPENTKYPQDSRISKNNTI